MKIEAIKEVLDEKWPHSNLFSLNRRGSSLDPCGTPQVMLTGFPILVCVYRCGRFVCATPSQSAYGATAERRRAGEGAAFWHCPHPAGCWAGSRLQHRPAGDGGKNKCTQTYRNSTNVTEHPGT